VRVNGAGFAMACTVVAAPAHFVGMFLNPSGLEGKLRARRDSVKALLI